MYKILLADDDADDAEIFYEALHKVDPATSFYRVETGTGILDYLQDKKNDRPDVVFLDLNMPKMNGWQCLAKLKNTKEYEHIPVIMYTTSSNPRDKEIAEDLNAHGLVTKPSNPKVLERVLSLVLSGIKSDQLKQAVRDAYIISKEQGSVL